MSNPGVVFSAGTTTNNLTAVTFSNSNGVTFGLNAGVLTASAAGGGGGSVNISAGSTSTNASAFTFSNGNNVTFGLGTGANAGIITASVVPPSGAAINVSAGTTSTNAGAFTFSNANNVSFGLGTGANAGNITASIATTYAGTGFTSTTTAGTAIVGTQNTSGLSLGVPAFLTTAMQSNAATISNVNVSAGTTSNNLSAVTFSNANGVSFGLNASTITASIATTYAGTGFTTTTIAGAVVAGTHDTNGLKLAVPAYLTTAMQSNAATISNVNVSAGTTSNNLSAVTFSNANGVSFGLNASTVTASIATTYAGTGFTSTTTAGTAVVGTLNTSGLSLGVPAFLTTAMQSNAATISNINVSAGTTSTNASAFTFSNANNVSFGIGTGANVGVITASVVPPSGAAINISAGTTSTNAGAFTFSNGSGVSFGIGTGASAGVITATVQTNYLTTAMQSNAATISNINVSAGTTSTNASAFTLSNGGGVSFGLGTGANAGIVTATVQTNYLTTAALSSQTLAFTLSGNIATTNSSQILNGGYALAGGNNVTIQQSNNTVSISVGNYITTGALSSQTLAFSLGGNSATTNSSQILNGGYVLAGGANVTIQQSNNTISISAGSAAPSPVNFSAGTTSGNLASVVFSNSNGVSFGLNGSTITASAVGGGGGVGAGVSNLGNTAGSTGTVTTGNVVFVGTGPISLSQSTAGAGSAATISINGPPITSFVGVSPVSLSTAGSTISVQLAPELEFCPYSQLSLITNSTLGQSSLYFVPFDLDGYVIGSRLNAYMSIATTFSSTGSNTAWLAMGYGLYTRGTGVSTDRISLLTSYSMSIISVSATSVTAFSATHYIGLSNATSHSTSQFGTQSSNVSTYMATSLGGFRVVAFPLNVTLTNGRYWLGISVQSASNNASLVVNASVMQQVMSNNLAFRPFGVNSAASNASFYNPNLAGSYSAQSAAWPNSVALTTADIRHAPAAVIPYFNISGLSTNTNLL